MSIYKIADTNVLMDFPQIIQREENLIISTDVLKELDGLKKHVNKEVAFKARRAAVAISKSIDTLIFDDSMDTKVLPVDDKLIELTRNRAGTLITNDVYLKIKAKLAGLQTTGYGGVEDYTGVKEWVVEFDEDGYNAQLAQVFTDYQPPEQFEMKENEYLIVRDSRDNEVLEIFCWRNNSLDKVMYHEIHNRAIRKIKPRPNNPEQVCLFDALYNPEITILYAGGPQGAGKSFLLNNYALQQLENGSIRRIVYIPNNAYVENSMELGALPG